MYNMGRQEAIGNGSHALVIGSSMAGLLTARVLLNHFDRVTLVERDSEALLRSPLASPLGRSADRLPQEPEVRQVASLRDAARTLQFVIRNDARPDARSSLTLRYR